MVGWITIDDRYFVIDVSEPGDYRYTIYELYGNDHSISYGERYYTAGIFAENNEAGGISCAVSLVSSDSSSKAENVQFRSTALSDSAETETATAAAADSDNSQNNGKIQAMIDSVMTGDSFPVNAFRMTLAVSVLTAVSAALFKLLKGKGEDTVTPLEDGDETVITAVRTDEATPDGEENAHSYDYFASYDYGENDSSRVDIITNTREGGISFRLFKWDSGVPIAALPLNDKLRYV